MTRTQTHRPGFTRPDLLGLVFALVVLAGLLLPGCQENRVRNGVYYQSVNNLKQMGLAIHNSASNTNGKFYVGDHGRVGTTRGGFFVEILPYLEGDGIYDNISGTFAGKVVKGTITDPPGPPGSPTGYPPFKPYYAPLDSLADPTLPTLSYGLNGYIVNRGTTREGAFRAVKQGGVKEKVAIIPDTFKQRGTSNIVAIAERTANNERTYYGTDIYFSPPHISAFPPTSAGFSPADATAFTARGTQVVMMDGSVRPVNVKLGGKVAGDNSAFDIACSLNNSAELPPDW
jgi:hypothetical protein